MKTNTDTSIPIHITPHHLTLTPSLTACVRGNVRKLSHYANDALAAHIVLRRHHGTAEGKQFSASLRLAVPGRDLHASATHEDLYTAIAKMTRRLARRSRKRKTRRVRAARNLRRTRLVESTGIAMQLPGGDVVQTHRLNAPDPWTPGMRAGVEQNAVSLRQPHP